MNKFTLAISLVTALCAVPSAALAIEPYLPKSTKVFAKLDADSNGKITLSEIQSKAEKRFLKLDGDGNGAVSKEEIDKFLRKAVETRRDRILKSMDADSDNSISKAELDGFVTKMLADADVDGDGGVSIDEAKKYRVAKLHKPATGESSN